MKVQCDVCERNKAAVMCCADEAVLCSDCDTRVHAANKLAIKHQRISLITPSEAPRCDICQVSLHLGLCGTPPSVGDVLERLLFSSV